MHLRTGLLAVVLLALMAGTAGAAEPPAETTHIATLDEPNTVSARFQQRGPGAPSGAASSPPPGSPPPPQGELPAGGPDLAVAIRDGRRRVRRGRQVRYRVRVRNHGTATARDVRVRIQLPRAVRHLRGGTLGAKHRVRWRIASLPVGATRTLNIRVRVRPRARARAITVTATAAVKGEELRGDNRARDTNRVRRPALQGAATG